MAKNVILKGKIRRQYRPNIRDINRGEPAAEARNIATYLYQKFQLSCVINGWFDTKLYCKDVEKGLSIRVRTFIDSDVPPFILAFKSTIRYPESSARRAEEIMAALAAYDYDSIRNFESPRPCPCSG